MKKIFIHSAFLLAVMAVLTSCLKDKGWEDGEYGIKDDNAVKAVSLPQAQAGLYLLSLNADPPEEQIDAVLVQLAAQQVAEEDVKVTLVKDMSLVAAYNNVNFTNYIEMPSNTYQILNPDGLTVTIPKGQSQVWLKMKIIKANFDFSQSYALGYSISSATPGYTIAANYRGMIIGVTVKNKFDGLWRLNGTLVDVANPNLGPLPNAPIAFVTSGPTSVAMFNRTTLVAAWFDQPFHPIVNAGAFSVYGGWAPVFNFNAADNLVSVTNNPAYGGPGPNPANTRGSVIDPTGINNYAVLSGVKTIRAKYIMTQPSVVPAPPNHRVFFNSTFTYVGPR
jgi:Domain of unknown function (DUF1735)